MIEEKTISLEQRLNELFLDDNNNISEYISSIKKDIELKNRRNYFCLKCNQYLKIIFLIKLK